MVCGCCDRGRAMCVVYQELGAEEIEVLLC